VPEGAPPDTPDGGPSLPTNRKAVYSVIFGAVAFPCAFVSPLLAFVLAVPSLTCGLHARLEIRDPNNAEGGDMTAIVGLTIGATTVALVVLSWLLSAL